MNNEYENEKNELRLSSKDTLNSNNNNFALLFTNIDETKKLLKSYEIFINKYFESINSYFKELTEFNFNFLSEDNFKSSIINSPIFQLGKAIKKAVQSQIDNLFSIITNQKIFFAFIEALSNLSKIMQISPSKFGKNLTGNNESHIRPVVISLMETFSEIELKITDEYINKKYNKHVLGINENPLKDNIEKALFLEKTFLVFEEDTKKQLLNDLQEMEKQTSETFNKMKEIVKNIIDILRENNNAYLDELQEEINLIGKRPKMSNKSLNTSYISVHNSEPEIEIKNEDNLDMLKYRIKIINNPKIHVKDNIETINIWDDLIANIEDNKTKNNDEDNNKDIKKDNKKYKINELALTEEDVYNIISSFYKYDFKMLNKSEYDLNIEKEKLKVSKLTDKLLTFDWENKKKEIITDEEANQLYESINDSETLLKFFIKLNNYRTTGRYEATQRSFNILVNIFNKAQDFLINNREVILEGLILILSQTYFIKKDGKKIYLQKAIKDHPLFKIKTFWINYLNDTIDEEIEKITKEENKKISNKEYQEKINELIFSKIVAFDSYMNDFGVKEEMIMNIINNIFDRYHIDEEHKNMILSLLTKKNN